MSTGNAQTEFDLSEFETDVTDADEERLIETIAESIERLRDQIDDDTLNGIFRAEPGQYTMRSDFTRMRRDQYLSALAHDAYAEADSEEDAEWVEDVETGPELEHRLKEAGVWTEPTDVVA